MLTDVEIAQSASMLPIKEIAQKVLTARVQAAADAWRAEA